MQKAKNPILNNIEKSQTIDRAYSASYAGIVTKTGVLLLFTVLSGIFAWFLLGTAQEEAVLTILGVSGITALIAVMVASFFPRLAMPFSILYTLAQGFTLGTLTFLVETIFEGQGLALTAVVITVIIFGVMLALYSSRTIRATNRFRKVMFVSIISILIFTIISALVPPIANLFVNNFALGALMSVILILYGAFMLILNFDQAEMIVTHGADKRYEWSVSLGLIITIIWIYVEVIRLLVIIASNRD